MTLNDLDGKAWLPLTRSWFPLRPKPRNKQRIRHPATFPPELPQRFITFFTRKGAHVIDPFAGVGTSMLVAQALGRNCAGIELYPENCRNIRISMSETLSPVQWKLYQGDAIQVKDLLAKDYATSTFDLCITSPPYYKMLGNHRGGSDSQHGERAERGLPLDYGELPNDLGRESDYQSYLTKLTQIFRDLKHFLKPQAHLVIVLQNIWGDDQQYYPMAFDFAAMLRGEYQQLPEQIWVQENKRLGIWGFPKTYIANIHHHYCLIWKNEKDIR